MSQNGRMLITYVMSDSSEFLGRFYQNMKGGIDAIAHSTGGPVIRDRLQRNYTPGRASVKHLAMLAPANFGSPGCRVLRDTS